MRLPEAVIFDLDDTILDDMGAVDSCWREVCGLGAAQLDGITAAQLLAAIERERDWFWSDPRRHREGRLDLRAATRGIVERAVAALGCDRPELAHEIADGYRDLRDQKIRLVPRAIETVEWFRDRGVRLGMATNGAADAQRRKIERFGLAPYFEKIIVEGEFGLGKPRREVYETLFSALGVVPEKTWSVGDNLDWDVGALQAFGCYGIWVDVRGNGPPSESAVKPDRTIRSIAELVDSRGGSRLEAERRIAVSDQNERVPLHPVSPAHDAHYEGEQALRIPAREQYCEPANDDDE
jgi:putative hydrolase of the HAD superfamily